jgi:hypothetical protein
VHSGKSVRSRAPTSSDTPSSRNPANSGEIGPSFSIGGAIVCAPRVMSGSGPFGPSARGVWQSLQPNALTM